LSPERRSMRGSLPPQSSLNKYGIGKHWAFSENPARRPPRRESGHGRHGRQGRAFNG
jgi:hypothetical protein